MNIFDLYLEKIIQIINTAQDEGLLKLPDKLNGINVDIPPTQFNCDISTNVAMVLSKPNQKSPIEIANQLSQLIKKNDNEIDDISVAKPGFINIKFKYEFWNNFLKSIILDYKNFGINKKEKKKNYLIEFVSANPTGPLHVGHCRGAILGDILTNLLKFNNHKITKEYYVNDYGNQILHFTKSVYLRIREILNKETYPSNDPDLYPGDYLIDIANLIIKKNKNLNFDNFKDISKILTKLSVAESLKLIKSNLKNLGIVHDNFASETNIIENNEVKKVIKKLKKNNVVYEGTIKAPEGKDKAQWIEREQLLFKSTLFGDDKDRALQKADKSWTYFASDVAYHNTKLDRRFDVLINILGADHAGYIKRITSAVEALSGQKNKLICKVSQLVKLMKNGKPYKMSKRKGDYITIEDLIREVGKDATRFIMLNRTSDVEFDFDFTKVKEKSKDNPLYYVQYCYARISSVFRNTNKNITDDIKIDKFQFTYSKDEIKILKKISEWPKCIEISSNKLEPHRITVYLYELASQIGSGLTGVLYVLDEPSIGLHQKDNVKLINALKRLRDLGNTVIVVEHDTETMKNADHIIDLGPDAGNNGGHVVVQGTYEDIIKSENSITGKYLSNKKFIQIPSTRRLAKNGRFLEINGATGNNLNNVTLKIPLGSFTCVTGVSGSGKSTLILQTLYNALNLTLNNNKSRKIPKPFKGFKGIELIDKVIDIDQSPIGRTPRSNPATYTGAFGPIRDWFTALPESKSRGYKPGRFSFNVKGGRCEACEGDGVITYEMHFLPDVYIQCDECKGTRYNRETLEIKFKDKSIADILNMTVDEGCDYFENISNIKTKLLTLKKVGLGYIKIGQQATTLSGGEAQRIKLAKELSKRSTGRTMYILDEPTTGLHQHDIKKLLEILHTFVKLGNTVVVIEHNLDVIKTSDYIVDMGPEGGVKGGNIIAEGKPEEICNIKGSYTGEFLKTMLNDKFKKIA